MSKPDLDLFAYQVLDVLNSKGPLDNVSLFDEVGQKYKNANKELGIAEFYHGLFYLAETKSLICKECKNNVPLYSIRGAGRDELKKFQQSPPQPRIKLAVFAPG